MKVETTRVIEVRAFREGGQPTCALNFQEGRVCQFAGSRHFGLIKTCLALGQDLFYPEGDNPFSRPLAGCPVWKV